MFYSQLLQPYSRGEITLSSTDPHDHPIIDPKYYSDPRDIECVVEGKYLCIRKFQTRTRIVCPALETCKTIRIKCSSFYEKKKRKTFTNFVENFSKPGFFKHNLQCFPVRLAVDARFERHKSSGLAAEFLLASSCSGIITIFRVATCILTLRPSGKPQIGWVVGLYFFTFFLTKHYITRLESFTCENRGSWDFALLAEKLDN